MPPTPTSTPTPVAGDLNGVRLSEVLAVPQAANGNGDGAATSRDEWIELYNSTSRALDLGGWLLDTGTAGNKLYRIPAVTIRPRAFFALYRSDVGLSLDDGGGQVRLLDPKGQLVDAVTYPGLPPDASYSLGPDGAWHADWPPSPGRENLRPGTN
jgi:hypothetical protein